MRKILIILSVISLSVVLFAAAGDNTAAGTEITNSAAVGGGNFTTVISAQVGTNVITNYGGKWSGEADIGGAVAGAVVTNTTFLTNLGNSQDIFELTVRAAEVQTNAAVFCDYGNWSYQFNNDTSGMSDITLCTTVAGSLAEIEFLATVGGAAQNSAYVGYMLRAQVNNGTSNARYTNYTGDNGADYAGDVGISTAGPSWVLVTGNTK